MFSNCSFIPRHPFLPMESSSSLLSTCDSYQVDRTHSPMQVSMVPSVLVFMSMFRKPSLFGYSIFIILSLFVESHYRVFGFLLMSCSPECQHGGICDDYSLLCNCTFPFTGDSCEFLLDPVRWVLILFLFILLLLLLFIFSVKWKEYKVMKK